MGYTLGTKFKIEDEVWYMLDNHPTIGVIRGIDISITPRTDTKTKFPNMLIKYNGNWKGTTHKFSRNENQLFNTKQDLINSL